MTLIVRAATLNDLSAIMAFSRQAHDASMTYEPLGFNSVIWRNTLRQCLSDPTMTVLISKRGQIVLGLLILMKMPMPWCGGFCASDLVFVAKQGGDLLLKAGVEWCKTKKIRRIDMGVSEPGDIEAKDRLFSREGFEQAGRVYYQILEVKA